MFLGEVIHVEITKQQCIDSHLITKEAFEAALQKFSSVFSAKGGAQNTTPLVEAVPIASTSKSNTSQGKFMSTDNRRSGKREIFREGFWGNF